MAIGSINLGIKKLEPGVLWKVHVGLFLVQVAYGSSYIFSKVALTTGVNPIVFAAYRDCVCLIALIPLALVAERGKRTTLTFEVFMFMLAVGFFGVFITQLLSLYGLMLTSAAYASTISVLTPLFTFIISTSCGFEQIRWRRVDGLAKLGGLISAIFGAVVLAVYVGPVVIKHVNSGVHESSSSDYNTSGLAVDSLLYSIIGPWQLGILCLFLAGFTLSICISIQSPAMARYPAPMTMSAGGYLSGAIMLFVIAFFSVKDWSDLVIVERAAVISYVYNGLVPAAFAFTTLTWCVHKGGPILAGSYIPLQLFTAAALAHIFLGESIHLGSILGTLLIFNGLGFITWGQVKGRPDVVISVKSAAPADGLPIIAETPSLEEPLLS
ncbi:unnamed protein product [Calypogeia fissa]